MSIPNFRRFSPIIFAAIAGLVAIRMVLPFYLKQVINTSLAKHLGEYEGSIQDLDLSIYRGAYQLEGLVIQKKNLSTQPLLKVQNIDIGLSWAALMKKEISAVVGLEKLDVVISDSKDKNKRQYGSEENKKSWQAVFQTILPISIESLTIKNSSLTLQNLDFTHKNFVQLENIFFTAQNLRTRDQDILSPVELSGLLQGHSPLGAVGQVDILSQPPRGNFDLTLKGFDVSTTNALLRHYIPIDVTTGKLDIYSEAIYENSKAHGYAKVFLKNADIIAPKQKFISGKHFLIEIVSAFANWILKNNETKKIAVQVPFHFENGKWDLNASDVFWSSLANKIDGLDPKLDNTVSFSKGVKSL